MCLPLARRVQGDAATRLHSRLNGLLDGRTLALLRRRRQPLLRPLLLHLRGDGSTVVSAFLALLPFIPCRKSKCALNIFHEHPVGLDL